MSSNPSVNTTAAIVVSVIFPVLSALSMLVRFGARAKARQPFKADDWWIVITWIVTFGLSLNTWISTAQSGLNYLAGSTEAEITASIMRETQGLFVAALLLQVCLCTVKISILCFYKRIFSVGKFVWVANVALAIVSLWGIIYFFLILFQDDPVSGAWTGQGVNVVPSTPLNISEASTSLILDVLILFLPIRPVTRLHMSNKRKIAVLGIFWLGAFCCVAASLRLAYLVEGEAAATSSKSNAGYTAIAKDTLTALFITIEPNCSIIAACLPCYGPLLEGRTVESIIHSVRSALSLQSRPSETSDSPSGTREDTQTRKLSDRSDSNESRIELQQAAADWKSSHTSNEAYAEAQPYSVPQPASGIGITRTYETRNSEV